MQQGGKVPPQRPAMGRNTPVKGVAVAAEAARKHEGAGAATDRTTAYTDPPLLLRPRVSAALEGLRVVTIVKILLRQPRAYTTTTLLYILSRL